MDSILITGGAGYIGSQAAKQLSIMGFRPVVLDDLSSGYEDAVQWGPFVKADIGDAEAVYSALKTHRIRAVLHFAALADVGESTRDPGKYLETNYTKTGLLLDAMNAAGVGHLVFSSTCATYGIPRQVPIDECHLQRPISPYGQSKLLAELAIHDHGLRHGLRWVILRYFNAAGLDPERDYASQREPAFRLIPRVLQTAAGFRNYLEVYGDSHPTEDGTAVRDYVHVKDLAAAHGSALHYLLGGGESRAFNLGNGTGYSVKQVIQAATRQTGKPLDFQIRPIRAGDPPKLVANAGAASSILNWRPQFPNLDEILRTSWKWYLQNQNRRSSVPKKNSTPPPLAKAAGS